MVATGEPQTYCEIGSGNSTKFAALARRSHSPATRFISIDPVPRAEVDLLCDMVIRQPLQECELSIFESLRAGDILFLDGSHRVLQNSDVNVFFLEVLPEIQPGVLIHIHDISWLWDYPSVWSKRMYSEQYMLGVLLLYSADSFEILLPNAYVSSHPDLMSMFDLLWKAPALQGIQAWGGSFWFRKR
jgi:hypothetical protein